MISKLQFYERPNTTFHSDQLLSQYLKAHFSGWSLNRSVEENMPASEVDPEK